MSQPDRPDAHEFQYATRQSAAALLLVFAQLFLNFIKQYWAFFLVILFRPASSRASFFGWVTLVLAAIVLVRSLVAFFTTSFRIDAGELIMESGLLSRRKLSIPLERIQTVTLQQTFLHRLFRAAKVEIDTSGAQQKEFSLTALNMEKAQRLRAYLMAHRQEEGAPQAGQPVSRPEGQVLLQLDLDDLLKVGITQNHLRTTGILLGLGLGVFSELSQTLGKTFTNSLKDQWGYIYGHWTMLILVFTVALILLSFLVTLLRTVARYYGLEFVQSGQGFRLSAGLFTRHEQSISLPKVQMVKWSANPLQRKLGYHVLQIYQGGGLLAAAAASLKAPGCKAPQISAVLMGCFPQLNSEPWDTHPISSSYAQRRFLFLGLVPGVILAAAALLRGSVNPLIFAAIWVPLTYYWQRQLQKSWSVQINPTGIQLSYGFFTRYYRQSPWEKIQALTINQSPFQQRKGLCDVELHTASSTLEIPFVPLELAHGLRDYALWVVERPGSKEGIRRKTPGAGR